MQRLVAVLALALQAPVAWAQQTTWADVAPIFAERCTHCHSGDWPPNGLDLTSFQAFMAGSWSGPVATAGDFESPLLRRLRGAISPRMPLDGPPFLGSAEIASVEAWVSGGLSEGSFVAAVEARPVPAPGEPVYWPDVKPIFDRHCRECHTEGGKRGAPPEGLKLDSLEAVLKGGERLAVLPGNHRLSEVWRRVTGLGRPRMPFDGPRWLDEVEIRLIRDWIDGGAMDADGNPAPNPTGARVRMRGRLTGPAEIDGGRFLITSGTRIDDRPRVGQEAEMRGRVLPGGEVAATRFRDR